MIPLHHPPNTPFSQEAAEDARRRTSWSLRVTQSTWGANEAPSSQCGKRSKTLHPAFTVGGWEGSFKKITHAG